MKTLAEYPSERSSYQDRVSGLTVWRLTSYLGHSRHPYFTDDGWFDDDRRMLFTSDRNNVRNLFSIEMESGLIHRLTEMSGQGTGVAFTMDVNRVRQETYYSMGDTVYALSLRDLSTRPIYSVPEGYRFGGARPTADGQYVVGGLGEDLSARIHSNLSAGYVGMREIFEAKPDSRIIRINLDTNEVEEVWQEKTWVGHVNPSPTQANLLTFCHEGPWQLVDHRIWLLDMDTGVAGRLRERRVKDEMIGHEYWFQDGLHIGYQVHQPQADGTRDTLLGFVHYDGSGEIEAPCIALPSPDHIHSNGFDLVVSDAGRHIKAYQYDGERFDGPRILCMHDGSFDWGAHHPHPRLTRDGRYAIFNSTSSGYCDIYMVEVPESINVLPLAEADKRY